MRATTTTLVAIAGVAGLLTMAACGSAATAPTESVSDSGSAAAWIGTKGVEMTFTNTSPETVYIGTRYNNDIQALGPNESRTYRGERSGADDLELFVRWASSGDQGIDLDGSNPSMGYPNWQVFGKNVPDRKNAGCGNLYFAEGEDKECEMYVNDVWTSVGIRRDSDSSDFKRFTAGICRGGYKGDARAVYSAGRWQCW